MLSNALVEGTTSIFSKIVSMEQSLSKIVVQDILLKSNEFKDLETVNLMVRFEEASKTGEGISNKLGITEEQIIQFCLEDDET